MCFWLNNAHVETNILQLRRTETPTLNNRVIHTAVVLLPRTVMPHSLITHTVVIRRKLEFIHFFDDSPHTLNVNATYLVSMSISSNAIFPVWYMKLVRKRRCFNLFIGKASLLVSFATKPILSYFCEGT